MRNTILGEGLWNFGLCSTLMAIEHWWNFSVLYMYMIWHGASFYKVLTQWPLHLVAFYNKPGVLMTFYNPVQHRIRYNCIKHTYDTYSLFVSFFTIPRVQGMVVFRYSLNKCFCHSLFIFYLLLWNIYSGKITHKGKSYLVAYIIVFLLYRLYVVNQIGFALFLLTKFHCFLAIKLFPLILHNVSMCLLWYVLRNVWIKNSPLISIFFIYVINAFLSHALFCICHFSLWWNFTLQSSLYSFWHIVQYIDHIFVSKKK